MKNIAILTFIVCLLAAGQSAVAQSQTATLDNGRSQSMKAKPAEKTVDTEPARLSYENSNNDLDINQDQPREQDETLIYPQDIIVLQDELFNSTSNAEVVEQLEAMKRVIRQLQAEQDILKKENELFRRSLAACCSADESGLGAKDAYLLQNAPNPFVNNTRVDYYVPEHLTNVIIELRDIKGALIASYPVRPGKSSVNIDRNSLEAGSYLYALIVDGEMIDTKVMIFKP